MSASLLVAFGWCTIEQMWLADSEAASALAGVLQHHEWQRLSAVWSPQVGFLGLHITCICVGFHDGMLQIAWRRVMQIGTLPLLLLEAHQQCSATQP